MLYYIKRDESHIKAAQRGFNEVPSVKVEASELSFIKKLPLTDQLNYFRGL